MIYKEMTVTPEMAKEWLETSTGNRSLNHREIVDMVDDILNDRWEMTGQPIIMSENMQTLIDGHHRLNACVIANKPIRVLVVIGGQKSTKIDTGMRRNAKQSLIMANMIHKDHPLNSTAIIGMVNMIYLIKENNARPTSNKIMEFYTDHAQSIDSLMLTIMGHYKAKGIVTAPLMVAVLSAFESGVDIDLIDEWYRVLRSGMYDDAKLRSTKAAKSIILLGNSLRTTSVKNFDDRLKVIKKVMSSINHYDRNEYITKLYGEMVYDIPAPRGENDHP